MKKNLILPLSTLVISSILLTSLPQSYASESIATSKQQEDLQEDKQLLKEMKEEARLMEEEENKIIEKELKIKKKSINKRIEEKFGEKIKSRTAKSLDTENGVLSEDEKNVVQEIIGEEKDKSIERIAEGLRSWNWVGFQYHSLKEKLSHFLDLQI
ncbi:hypothetical protein JNUCC42_04385 [Brevibacterium sp. JNUCC-42]|nr:hypothetical protein JNUCC42_04385 [Brevibacterium sp. JNUCC-42]